MEINHLPVIDWELGIKLAGNKRDLAEDMLALFIKNLPAEVNQLNDLYQSQNYKKLLQEIHKMHGAICYCGLPRLKLLVSRLESNLKNHIMDDLPILFGQLNIEFQLLLEQYAH